MMPRLGQKYEIEVETISKPIAEYQTDEYFELDLPTAPAVMVGEEIVAEGADVPEDKLAAVICRHLGLAHNGVSAISERPGRAGLGRAVLWSCHRARRPSSHSRRRIRCRPGIDADS